MDVGEFINLAAVGAALGTRMMDVQRLSNKSHLH